MTETAATFVERERQRMHAELTEYGYQDIAEHRGIKVGARVRHCGQRYYEAIENGTATVLAVMQKDPSPWADSYGRPDIEVLVADDKPMFPGSPVSQWADYHCAVVRVAESPAGGSAGSSGAPAVHGGTGEAQEGSDG